MLSKRTKLAAACAALILLAAPVSAETKMDSHLFARKLFQGAFTMNKLGNPVAALMLYQDGLAIQPDNARAHFDLAELLVQADELIDAKGHYRKVIELAPQSAEAQQAKTKIAAPPLAALP